MAAITSAVAVAGATVYSANKASKSAKAAAAAQQAGIESAQAYNKEAAEASSKMLDPLAALREPSQADLVSTMQQNRAIGNYGTAGLIAQQGDLNVNKFSNPMMQAQLDAGRNAVESSAAARGGLLSGATLQSLQKTGAQIAGANWQNAANLALADRTQQTNIANTLAGQGDLATNINQRLYDTGINAVGQQANIIAGQGANNANLAMTSGNVAAASRASQPSATATGLQALVGGLGANNGAGWTALGGMFSDERMKFMEGEVSDDEIDDFLSKLTPSQFEYTDEVLDKYEDTGKVSSGERVGVMAQDVEKSKVGKTIVSEDAEGNKQLDIPQSVGTLLASTASLNRRIKKLEGKK